MKKLVLLIALSIVLTGCSEKTDDVTTNHVTESSVTKGMTSEEITSESNEISKTKNEREEEIITSNAKSKDDSQNEEMGLFKISCEYPSDIEPQEDDAFILYYKTEGSDKLEYVLINAYEYNEHFQEVDLPIGKIFIVGVVYTGNNSQIANDVYAVPINIPIRGEDDVFVRTNIIIGEHNVTRAMEGGKTKYVLNGERVVEADENYAKIEQASPEDFIKELSED
jgi:hypothetical protein